MKLWGGRFEKATDGMVDDFHSSISFDKRLYKQDIRGSIAHATMLGEQGIIPKEDADKIVEGLKVYSPTSTQAMFNLRWTPRTYT